MYASNVTIHALSAISLKTFVTHALLLQDCRTLQLMVIVTKNVLKAHMQTRQPSNVTLALTPAQLVLIKGNV